MPGNLHDVPLSAPESWPTPNYVDPVTRPWMPAFSLTWAIVATLLVFGRFCLRASGRAGEFGLDDVFIGIAWFFSLGLTACVWLLSELYGLDRHIWDVPVDEVTPAVLLGWVVQLLVLVSTAAAKASGLMFYRRMMAGTYSKRWKYAIWAALAFTALYFVGILLTLFLVCTPLESYWMSYSPTWKQPYHCIPAIALNPVNSILSVLSDLYAVILPCVMLQHYNLHIPFRQKIGLNMLFALSTFIPGAGIARTYYSIKLGQTYDTSWTAFDLFAWSIVECQLAIICACAPSMRALFRRYLSDRSYRSFHASSYNRNKQLTNSSTSHSNPPRNSTILNSTICNNTMVHDLEAKLAFIASHQKLSELPAELVEEVEMDDVEPNRSLSSNPMLIRTAEDYEAYNLKQLSRHPLGQHGFKRANASEITYPSPVSYGIPDPRRQHTVENAV